MNPTCRTCGLATHRVSGSRSHGQIYYSWAHDAYGQDHKATSPFRPPPRFSIIRFGSHGVMALTDRSRPHFFGRYQTLDLACRAMDNTVRRERGMPERIAVTTAEIRDAIEEPSRSNRRAEIIRGMYERGGFRGVQA